jgi:hypothetical protein
MTARAILIFWLCPPEKRPHERIAERAHTHELKVFFYNVLLPDFQEFTVRVQHFVNRNWKVRGWRSRFFCGTYPTLFAWETMVPAVGLIKRRIRRISVLFAAAVFAQNGNVISVTDLQIDPVKHIGRRTGIGEEQVLRFNHIKHQPF